METKEGMKEMLAPHRVWVGETDRIASFHEVETYKLETFTCFDTFMKYLRTLQEYGFRFQ